MICSATTSTPALSIVFCLRNDNRNGDFDLRARRALSHNRALLAALGVKCEWICVEWNPIPDKQLLSGAVSKWLPGVRCHVVPKQIHETLTRNPNLGMLQFHAKNAGIRRSRGEWILCINADTILSGDVATTLCDLNKLERTTIYLASRCDIDQNSVPSERTGDILPEEHFRVTLEDTPDPPRIYGSAGDFTLAHQSAWNRTRGYCEGIAFSNIHHDTHFCRQAHSMDIGAETVGKVYHVEHSDECHKQKPDDPKHHHGTQYCEQHVQIPYCNPENWGLMDYAEQMNDGNITLIGSTLPESQPIFSPPFLPPQLELFYTYKQDMDRSIKAINKDQRVVIYGFGEEARCMQASGSLNSLNIVGCLEDNPCALTQAPYTILTWNTLKEIEFDYILIGSLWWCYTLAENARARGFTDRILPSVLRTQRTFRP